jgi:hypothetical protein
VTVRLAYLVAEYEDIRGLNPMWPAWASAVHADIRQYDERWIVSLRLVNAPPG